MKWVKMKLEILLSTMNKNGKKENLQLIKKINAKTKTLTINQITKEEIKMEEDLESNNRLISVKDKGLSKSRNMAIQNANGDICIIADDDVKYVDDFENIIKNAYNKYKNYDVICFMYKVIKREKNKKTFLLK